MRLTQFREICLRKELQNHKYKIRLKGDYLVRKIKETSTNGKCHKCCKAQKNNIISVSYVIGIPP